MTGTGDDDTDKGSSTPPPPPIVIPIGNTNGYKEGVHFTSDDDGNTHQTKWYSNNSGSSRTSVDIDKDGNESDKHTKKQK